VVTQANTTNLFSQVITDNGSPSLSATQSFSVVVNPMTLPGVTGSIFSAQVNLSINGQVGPDYAVQGSTDAIRLRIRQPEELIFRW
jgi:hypothetical protein